MTTSRICIHHHHYYNYYYYYYQYYYVLREENTENYSLHVNSYCRQDDNIEFKLGTIYNIQIFHRNVAFLEHCVITTMPILN